MIMMSDRNTNKLSLASRSKTIHFKTKKYEAFHSLTVAVYCRGGS